MKFIIEGLVFLGSKKWVSKKTQKEYCVVSLLTPEGNVFQCFSEYEIAEDIKQLDKVDVEFLLSTGRYNRLTVKNIRKSA